MKIIDDRRALHRIPELDRDLPQTMAYLRQALAGLPCSLITPMEGALCAFFDFGRDTAIAFRSDADALPIAEKTGLPFASLHPGRSHACGHDGHMAMLLELARQISCRKSLSRNVLLVFQPAEETTGGARDLCRTGILEEYKVEAIFGAHLWPDLPAGVIASRPGAMMSRSCEVTCQVTGRSSHIAKASEGLDAMAAAVEFYRRALQLEASLPSASPRLLKFGLLEAGTVRNAVAGSARLLGSLRAFEDPLFFQLKDGLSAIGAEVAKETRCSIGLHFSDGYPAVWNSEVLYGRLRAAGLAFEELPEPVMITEDFSWYQRQLPGLFFFLGVGPAPALHAADFSFDESVLQKGADFFLKIAEKYESKACNF